MGTAPTLRLSTEQYQLIVAHCLDGLPDEACGLLSGPMDDAVPTGVVSEVHPCRNADESARSFTVHKDDHHRAWKVAESHGDELIGVWHSHTHTDAYPSPTDVRQAARQDPTWLWVIVSLRHGEPAMRAYTIRDEVISELDVVVT